jgi:DNA replication and repair protein RecF
MPLTRVTVTGIRNLASVTLSPSSKINVLYGSNGSGKTSFLEAIHLLGMARSFRSQRMQPVIQHDQQACTVHGVLQLETGRLTNVGVSRDMEGGLLIRVDGQAVRSAVQLATLMPLQVINPDSFRLLEGSPKNRRQYMDWGVFHVEQKFILAWQRFQQALRQRNAWLRHVKIDHSQQSVWNQEFSLASESIDAYRQAYICALKPHFEAVLGQLLQIDELSLSYYRGWERSRSLAEVLDSSLARDMSLGYTQAGPQRADLRLRIGGRNAIDVLSRGQQKQVICALKLAQGLMLTEAKRTQCIYLVDDLASELDLTNRAALCRLLESLGCQVFITCIDPKGFGSRWNQDTPVQMFHVEQGRLSPIHGSEHERYPYV